jgi:hypothetical protein
MGFEDAEVFDMYSNVAGIMNMGEMKFKQRPREEQAESDENTEGVQTNQFVIVLLIGGCTFRCKGCRKKFRCRPRFVFEGIGQTACARRY